MKHSFAIVCVALSQASLSVLFVACSLSVRLVVPRASRLSVVACVPMSDTELENALLAALAGAPESGLDTSTLGWDAAKLVGLVKSLEASGLIVAEARR